MRGTTASTVALGSARPARVEQPAGSTVVVTSCRPAEGAAVHRAMEGLWASPLGRDRPDGPGMPEPLGFDEHTGELRTARVPGPPLGDPRRVDLAVSRAVEVGTLLADLHGSG